MRGVETGEGEYRDENWRGDGGTSIAKQTRDGFTTCWLTGGPYDKNQGSHLHGK